VVGMVELVVEVVGRGEERGDSTEYETVHLMVS
jgi:hypothetical protein